MQLLAVAEQLFLAGSELFGLTFSQCSAIMFIFTPFPPPDVFLFLIFTLFDVFKIRIRGVARIF